jgi:hypothetical protein
MLDVKETVRFVAACTAGAGKSTATRMQRVARHAAKRDGRLLFIVVPIS